LIAFLALVLAVIVVSIENRRLRRELKHAQATASSTTLLAPFTLYGGTITQLNSPVVDLTIELPKLESTGDSMPSGEDAFAKSPQQD
jgi:hypothetical protein